MPLKLTSLVVALCSIQSAAVVRSAEPTNRVIEVPGLGLVDVPKEMTAQRLEQVLNDQFAFQVNPQSFKISVVPSSQVPSAKREAAPVAPVISQTPTPTPTGSSNPITNEVATVEGWGLFVGFLSVVVLVVSIVLHLRRRSTTGTTPAPAPTVSVTPVQPRPLTLYVLLNGNTQGPLSQDQVLDMMQQGQLLGETPAWKEGLADWKRLDQLIDLTSVVSKATPPPPPFTPTQNAIQGHKTFALTQPVNGARPGIRFLARFFDLVLFSNCIFLIVALAVPSLLPPNANTRAALFAFLWCFVEAALLSTWGVTPGKALLKVYVRNADGSQLSYADGVSRALDVWIRGLAMVLPVISLIALVVGYNRLAAKGTTSWDEKGNYRVTHGTVGPARIVVAIVLIVSALVVGLVEFQAAKGAGGR